MISYVNSVFCAYNAAEKTVVIKMRQDEPVDPDCNNGDPVHNDIAAVVISRELALKLADNINMLCANSEA